MEKNYYEECLSAISHYIGAGMAISGLVFLIFHSLHFKNLGYTIGGIIFSLGLIFMYMMSGTYHILQNEKFRRNFRVLDHIAIYVTISASYTPYIFTVLTGKTKWIIFFIEWGLTLFGVIFKLFFTGKFKLLSTLIYLFMGWVILFVFKDIKNSLNPTSLYFLIASGITYSVGAIVYMLRGIKFNHFTWHIFVLGGSILNFISIYLIHY